MVSKIIKGDRTDTSPRTPTPAKTLADRVITEPRQGEKRRTGTKRIMQRTLGMGEALKLTFGQFTVVLRPQTWLELESKYIVLFKFSLSGPNIRGEGIFELKKDSKEIIPVKVVKEWAGTEVFGVPISIMDIDNSGTFKVRLAVHLDLHKMSEERYNISIRS